MSYIVYTELKPEAKCFISSWYVAMGRVEVVQVLVN